MKLSIKNEFNSLKLSFTLRKYNDVCMELGHFPYKLFNETRVLFIQNNHLHNKHSNSFSTLPFTIYKKFSINLLPPKLNLRARLTSGTKLKQERDWKHLLKKIYYANGSQIH